MSAVPSRPIPALYTVYILRSTMRHASLYIGSTTNPPRRLKQHNGEIKGGAARTSRASLRPWEMVALVSGFPGAVAALKFEWALTNPHLSLHIPSASRLSVARQTKKNGLPRRPPASMQSIIANLHLLLGVPSFARWPLRLHVFAPDVLAAWNKWCTEAVETMEMTTAEAEAASKSAPSGTASGRRAIEVLTDFGPGVAAAQRPVGIAHNAIHITDADADVDAQIHPPWGIHALPLDYWPLRDYVDKAQDIFTFEREGDCAVCRAALPPGQGLYAVCPNAACEAVGHLRCWSAHLLDGEAPAAASGATSGAVPAAAAANKNVIPVKGTCPACGGPVVWGDMMKELTLRMRAPKEVEKLVRAKRRLDKAGGGVAVAEGETETFLDVAEAVAGLASAPATTKTRARAAKPKAAITAKTAKTTKTTKTIKAAQTAKTAKKPIADHQAATTSSVLPRGSSRGRVRGGGDTSPDASPEVIVL